MRSGLFLVVDKTISPQSPLSGYEAFQYIKSSSADRVFRRTLKISFARQLKSWEMLKT